MLNQDNQKTKQTEGNKASTKNDTNKIPDAHVSTDDHTSDNVNINEEDNIMENSADSKPVLFNIVYLHGILKSFNIRDFKGRKCIRISLSTSYDDFHHNKDRPVDYLPAEIDIYVERKKLVAQYKQWLIPGNMLLVEGRIMLSFNRTSQDSVKKRQYIGVNNIISSKGSVIDNRDQKEHYRRKGVDKASETDM